LVADRGAVGALDGAASAFAGLVGLSEAENIAAAQNSIEFRLAAPMGVAAVSPVRCCAWPGADSTTANPATRVQYIRI
jgi:hypothetical protein